LTWCPQNSGEIKRRPEVETFLITRDNRTEIMKKVLGWLTIKGKIQGRGQKATSIIAEELYPLSRREDNPHCDTH
jgi:hypothetical protein